MRRPTRIALVVLAALAFLAASAGLARVLAAFSSERSAAVDAVRARARAGDRFQLVRVDAPTRIELGSRTSVLRVVWREEGGRPVVQCVRVVRTGSLVEGFRVRAGRAGAPIPNEGSCPRAE